MRAVPALTPNGESEFRVISIAKGDGEESMAAREWLLECHRPFIEAVVSRFHSRRDDREDAMQAGILGLLVALDRYDPTRGIPLWGFARAHVLGHVVRALRHRLRDPRLLDISWLADSGEVEVPDEASISAVTRFVGVLPQRLQYLVRRVFWEGASQADVARELGVSRKTVTVMMHKVYRLGRQMLFAYGRQAAAYDEAS